MKYLTNQTYSHKSASHLACWQVNIFMNILINKINHDSMSKNCNSIIFGTNNVTYQFGNVTNRFNYNLYQILIFCYGIIL